MFHRRAFIMGGVAAFGLLALTGRLAHLQILQGGKYTKLSAANQFNFRLIPPPRGNILDRNGKLIAGNRPSFRVMIMANEVKNIDDTLNQMSYVLPQTVTTRRRILRDINQNQRFVPTIVAGDLTWDDFSRVSLYANDIPGVVADMSELRAYYYGGAFSHVVGYVSKVSQKELDAESNDPDADSALNKLLHDPGFRIGKQGIEKAYDKQLRGQAGGRKVEVTSTGQVKGEDPTGSIAPVPGQDIVLTIDADIQQRAVDLFAENKDSGAAVMMNVHTGEILCMSSSPGFDPNLFVSGIPSSVYKLYSDYERKPLLDKAIGSTFAPGSTFKTMVALAALENGYDPKTTHTCGGVFPFGDHVFKCDSHHGTLDLHGAIVTSCDVYFYQCAPVDGRAGPGGSRGQQVRPGPDLRHRHRRPARRPCPHRPVEEGLFRQAQPRQHALVAGRDAELRHRPGLHQYQLPAELRDGVAPGQWPQGRPAAPRQIDRRRRPDLDPAYRGPAGQSRPHRLRPPGPWPTW